MNSLPHCGSVLSLVLLLPLHCGSQVRAEIPGAAHWYDYPEVLCAALARQGFSTGPWAHLGGGDSTPYECTYPAYPIRPKPAPTVGESLVEQFGGHTRQPLTSLAFQVSGDRVAADRVSIAITVRDPVARSQAKKQFLESIQALYAVIHQRVPPGLAQSIRAERHFLSHLPYGIVSFASTFDGKEQTLWFRLGKNH